MVNILACLQVGSHTASCPVHLNSALCCLILPGSSPMHLDPTFHLPDPELYNPYPALCCPDWAPHHQILLCASWTGPCTALAPHTRIRPCVLAIQSCVQGHTVHPWPQKYGSCEAAINTATTFPLPNFPSCTELCGPDDMTPWVGSCPQAEC